MNIFSSPKILEKEKPFLLNRWFFSGLHVNEIDRCSGLIVSYLDEQIIVTKDTFGTLSAFINSCPHRGTRLVSENQAIKNCITCPYHRWSFELNGSLRHSPLCNENLADVKIKPVKIGIWKGLIFLSFDHHVPSIEQYMSYLSPHIDDCEIHKFAQIYKRTFVLASNWKLLQQNFSESYHSAFWHPELEERSLGTIDYPVDSSVQNSDNSTMRRGDHFDSGFIAPPFQSMTLSGKKYVGSHNRIMYFSLYPNVLCSLTCDYLFIQRFLPIDIRTAQVDCYYFVDPVVDMEDVVDFWSMVFDQDREICEAGQLGNESRYFTQNRWTGHDIEVKEFTETYLEDMGIK